MHDGCSSCPQTIHYTDLMGAWDFNEAGAKVVYVTIEVAEVVIYVVLEEGV